MGALDGKVAVITGAGSGMAKASVKIFVREGAKVVAADISGAEQDTAAEVGEGVLPVHCDVTKEADVEAMIAAAVEEFGRIDAVLNVAGIADAMRVADVTMEHYDKVMDVDLRGVLLGMKHGISRDAPAAPGRRHRQLLVGRRAQRRAVHRRVLGGQGRRHRADQGRRGGVRAQGDPGQRDLPRLRPHRDHGRRRRRDARDAREGGARTAAVSRTRSRRSPRSWRPTARRS